MVKSNGRCLSEGSKSRRGSVGYLLASLHACRRYGQRILGMTRLSEARLLRDERLRGRCERGLFRIATSAHIAGSVEGGSHRTLLTCRTRRLIVRGRTIVTVITLSDAGGKNNSARSRTVRRARDNTRSGRYAWRPHLARAWS